MTHGESLIHPRRQADLLLFRLYRLHATAGRVVIRLCEAHSGLTRREWRVLSFVLENEGVLSSELAQKAMLDRARTSRALTRLTEKGLIRREPRPGNRREVQVFLSDAGRSLHAELFPRIAAINARLLQDLSAEDLAALHRLLSVLRRGADGLNGAFRSPEQG